MSYAERKTSGTYLVYNDRNVYQYQKVVSGITDSFKTDTMRRKRPADLFGGSTYFKVISRSSVVTRPLYYTDYSGRVKYWDYTCSGHWDQGTGIDLVQNSYTIPADQCDTKTLLKIKDEKVNLSVSIAELGKTTDMVFDFARSTLGFLRSLRRGRLRSAIRAIKSPRTRADKALAQRFLEYTYGWVPLAHDVYGLSEFIHRKIENDYIYGHAKFASERDISSQISPYLVLTGRCVRKRKNLYRYKVDSAGLRSLAQAGITNPAAVVWELVPYSFVLDWFFTVGDYLQSLDALVGIKDVEFIRSYREDYSLTANHSPGFGQYNGIGKIESHVYTVKVRNASTFQVFRGYPSYKAGTKTQYMKNALALLRNLFK